MELTTTFVSSVFIVTAGCVAVHAIDMNRPQVVENVVREVIVVQEVPTRIQQEAQSQMSATVSSNQVGEQSLVQHVCTTTGVVEYENTIVGRVWRATIGGIKYRSAYDTPISDDELIRQKISVGQTVCIVDPQDDQRVASDEIFVIDDPTSG